MQCVLSVLTGERKADDTGVLEGTDLICPCGTQTTAWWKGRSQCCKKSSHPPAQLGSLLHKQRLQGFPQHLPQMSTAQELQRVEAAEQRC